MSHSGSLTEQMKKKFRDAAYKAVDRVLSDAEEKIEKIHKQNVSVFYGDYKPQKYDRNYSLYDILDLEYDDESMTLHAEFIPEYMSGYRSGYDGEDGVYDLVFRQGWHGGATNGPGHPNPGTAYWRYPEPRYNKWFREPAKRAKDPVLKAIQDDWSNYKAKEMKFALKKYLMQELK